MATGQVRHARHGSSRRSEFMVAMDGFTNCNGCASISQKYMAVLGYGSLFTAYAIPLERSLPRRLFQRWVPRIPALVDPIAIVGVIYRRASIVAAPALAARLVQRSITSIRYSSRTHWSPGR